MGSHPRYGQQLAALAVEITRFIDDFMHTIQVSCLDPEGPCPMGFCHQHTMHSNILHSFHVFITGIDSIIHTLHDDDRLLEAAVGLAAATSDIAKITHCRDMLRGLTVLLDETPGCNPLIHEIMFCVRGFSDIARISMAELHVAQIAAVAMQPVPTADVGVPLPEKFVFDTTRGVERAEILVSLLHELLGNYPMRNSNGDDAPSAQHDGPFNAQVTAAEIGVDDGRTSEVLLETVPGLRLLLVDPYEFAKQGFFDSNPHFRPNSPGMADALWQKMRPFRNRSVIINQQSADAATLIALDSLDLVFIDGDHDYEAIREDIILWRPRLRVGGVLAGHDYSLFFPGTVRFVHEFASQTGATLFLGPDHMWWFHF